MDFEERVTVALSHRDQMLAYLNGEGDLADWLQSVHMGVDQVADLCSFFHSDERNPDGSGGLLDWTPQAETVMEQMLFALAESAKGALEAWRAGHR